MGSTMDERKILWVLGHLTALARHLEENLKYPRLRLEAENVIAQEKLWTSSQPIPDNIQHTLNFAAIS